MEEEVKQETPKWLKHLQENSWEAEIIISGGAIFSLLQLGSWIEGYSVHLKEIRATPGFNEVLIFLFLGLDGIIIGFFVHLIFRGYWIALVCLNYVFPKGINLERLRIKGSYFEKARSVNLTKQIVDLDHFSGLLFFGSLCFLLIIVGLIILSFNTALITRLFNSVIAFDIYLALFFMFLFDFVFNGLFRRNLTIGLLFKPIYWYFNSITLAFIYRPWLQIIFTNISRWKILTGVIVFLFASVLLTTSSSLARIMHWGSIFDARKSEFSWSGWTEDYYENRLTQEQIIGLACIQSDLVSDDYLRIFVPYRVQYDEVLMASKAVKFRDIVFLKLDDSPKLNEWLESIHNSTNQRGITCYLPIADIAKGKHVLTIEIGKGAQPLRFPLAIPFWKQ